MTLLFSIREQQVLFCPLCGELMYPSKDKRGRSIRVDYKGQTHDDHNHTYQMLKLTLKDEKEITEFNEALVGDYIVFRDPLIIPKRQKQQKLFDLYSEIEAREEF